MLIAEMCIQLVTGEERLITELTERMWIDRSVLRRGRAAVLEVVQQLLLCEELVLVNEHLSCCNTRLARLQRVDGLQVAVERVDGGEVLGGCGAAVRWVGVVVGLMFADWAVDGAQFEELFFGSVVLEVHLDGVVQQAVAPVAALQ